MIPIAATGTTTGGGAGVDELQLLDAMQTLWESAGITTVEGVLATDDIRWFQSPGEDGMHNIVCGIERDGVSSNRIQAYTAVDFNTTVMNGVTGLTAQTGYTNNDAGGATAHVTSATGTTPFTSWAARTNATAYAYAMVCNKDGIACWGDYTSSGGDSQFFICLGRTIAHTRGLYQQARAKVATVGAGTSANQRLITLDRDILAALKDNGTVGSPFPSDTFVQSLFFQTVEDDAIVAACDFAKTERAAIVADTLENSGGVTRFEIVVDKAVTTTKLFGTAATTDDRYSARATECAGDIVAVHAEPTVAVCGGGAGGTIAIFTGTANNSIVMCDAWGGQAARIDVILSNRRTATETNTDPDKVTLHNNWFHMNAVVNDLVTGIPVQANEEGRKIVGHLPNAIMTVKDDTSPQSFSTYTIDHDMSRTYYVMARISPNGLAAPSGFPGASGGDLCYAVGPFVTP